MLSCVADKMDAWYGVKPDLTPRAFVSHACVPHCAVGSLA